MLAATLCENNTRSRRIDVVDRIKISDVFFLQAPEVRLPLVEGEVVAEENEPVRVPAELPGDPGEGEEIPPRELHEPQAPRPEVELA
jgi:hypothetical protein